MSQQAWLVDFSDDLFLVYDSSEINMSLFLSTPTHIWLSQRERRLKQQQQKATRTVI